MRSFLRRVRHALPHLSESVHSLYGGGIMGYSKFVYYSFLCANRFVVYSKPLKKEPLPDALAGGYCFQALDMPALQKLRQGLDLPQEFYLDAVYGFKTAHAVIEGEKPAYIHWVYREGDASRFLRIPPGAAEIGYLATLPEHRRKGVCTWALRNALVLLESQGIERVFTVVHGDNYPSRKAMENIGMVEVATVRTFGPFNRRITIPGTR